MLELGSVEFVAFQLIQYVAEAKLTGFSDGCSSSLRYIKLNSSRVDAKEINCIAVLQFLLHTLKLDVTPHQALFDPLLTFSAEIKKYLPNRIPCVPPDHFDVVR